MSFSLNPSRPIPEAVRDAAEHELHSIVMALTGQAELGPDEAAHDARKRTKKVRALLRLARPELGDETFRLENRALRDAARRLSPVRDAWVLVETLDLLATPADALRAVLVADHRALQGDQGEGGVLEQAAADVEQVLARVSRWALADRGWRGLDKGLEDVARRGRHAMVRARDRGRAEDFHEWRKQVKYLRHQFGLLRETWPELLDAMERTADELGELLGTDHDLAVLRERTEREAVLSNEAQNALLSCIDERRSELQHQALTLGRRLYAEKPSSLSRRLGKLWKAAA